MGDLDPEDMRRIDQVAKWLILVSLIVLAFCFVEFLVGVPTP